MMRQPCSLSAIVLLAVVMGLALVRIAAASTPATAPTADDARIIRGRLVRAVLLDALEKSYRANGRWPSRLHAVPQTRGLTYVPPVIPTTGSVAELARRHPARFAATTVVLYESLDKNPAGVWVGYADGHLDFAPDATALSDCMTQIRIVSAEPEPPKDLPVAHATGRLTLRVRDPDRHPARGAHVGIWMTWGDAFPSRPPRFADSTQPLVVTDSAGQVTLDADQVFGAKFLIQQSAPLYILDATGTLAASLTVDRLDFTAQSALREVRLAPACKIIGHTTSLDIPGSAVHQGGLYVISQAFPPGNRRMYTLESVMKGPRFEYHLPPGDYGIDAYGIGSDSVLRYFHIAVGQRNLDLYLDLPPSTLTRLIGHPAPELKAIKGWKNSAPLKLASLRGKAVVLDFWGYWCHPCCEAMPDLMKLYDRYKNKGLVVIAIHDDSVASIKEMDAKLAPIRHKLWSGRELPFPVALDGGGMTRIKYSATFAKGATTAGYGITSFPTTLLISPDGVVVGQFDPASPDNVAELDRLLQQRHATTNGKQGND